MTFRLETSRSGLAVGRFDRLTVKHGIAARLGGVSEGPYASLNLGPLSGDDPARVAENRRRFLAAVGVAGLTPTAPRQVHSASVQAYHRGDRLPDRRIFEGDGLVTDDPGVVLTVLAADCAAVLLFDPVRLVVGVLHAGWRGTAGNIAARGVAVMVEAFHCEPTAVRAAIGPAIGVCCYEVGIDVAQSVAAAIPADARIYQPFGAAKAHLDIVAANVAQLVASGVLHENIATAELCTACRTDLFYSHRREGEPTGRFGAAITLAGAM